MNKRLNLEKKIDFDVFQPKLGTVNRNNPVSVYLTGKTYIIPKECKDDYKEDLRLLETDLKDDLRRFFASSPFLNKDFILNFEVSENGVKYGKKSYCFFQIFFTQKNEEIKPLQTLKSEISCDIDEMLKYVESHITSHGFSINEKRNAI